VVVTAGLTAADVSMATPGPTLGLMLRLVAPVTAQLRVLDCPEAMLAGAAAKLAMAGRLPTVTVTVAVAVPKALTPVRV